jgi:hypothetical protein
MNKVEERLATLKELKNNRDKGIIEGVPLWEKFPRLSKVVPTLEKGQVILNAAASGVGKSMITRWKDIVVPWLYVKNNPEVDIDLQFVIFLLEDPEEKFIDYIISIMLYLKFHISVPPKKLTSKAREELSKDILNKIDEVKDDVEDLLSKCIIHDTIYNSYGIYKTCRELSEDWGTHYYTSLFEEEKPQYITIVEKNKLKKLPSGEEKLDKAELLEKGYNLKEYQNFYKYSHYKPKNPKQHVITVTDNINCLNPDQYEKDLKTAMDNFAYKYMRINVAKHWHWSVVMVQQNVGGAEEKSFDYQGKMIIDKVTPQLSHLGDSKLTQRACHLIYALFSPSRYRIEEYMKYDVTRLQNNLRILFILKNNDGDTDVQIPLFFNGAASIFEELPLPEHMSKGVYEKIEKEQKNINKE